MTLAALVACGPGTDPKDSGTDTSSSSGTTSTTTTVPCTTSDIDATLTISDAEWLDQRYNPDAESPEMRPGANDVLNAYRDLGYAIVYITARGVDVVIADGRDATTATHDWLAEMNFPDLDGNLYLADGGGALGEEAAIYKTQVLADLEAGGLEFVYGYGDKPTDITAWQAAGIPNESIFHVGADTVETGVVALPSNQAYLQHITDHMANVPSACAR